jgi:hypothetical protein
MTTGTKASLWFAAGLAGLVATGVLVWPLSSWRVYAVFVAINVIVHCALFLGEMKGLAKGRYE